MNIPCLRCDILDALMKYDGKFRVSAMYTASRGKDFSDANGHTNLVDDQGHRKARNFLCCPEAQHGTVSPHIEACLNVCGTLRGKA